MKDIESLYQRYAPDVRRFSLFLSGDPVIADEITSDTFVSAWLAGERIRQPTVKSYLFTIARTLGIPVVTATVKAYRARLKLMETRQARREAIPSTGAKP